MTSDGDDGIALLWHGRGPREAYALAPLATELESAGLTVLAADWDSTAPDHGRADLEASLARATRLAADRAIDPGRLVVLGWSLGGTAALGLALQSDHPLHTILVAPGYAPRAIDAFSGLPLPEVFPGVTAASTSSGATATSSSTKRWPAAWAAACKTRAGRSR